MTDLKLYTKISNLPSEDRAQVIRFINSLKKGAPLTVGSKGKRVAGAAKGMIVMKNNFDDDIEGFDPYIK
jgi:hypothetical protein